MINVYDVGIRIATSSNHRDTLGSLISMLGVAEAKVQKLLKATGGMKTAFAGLAAIGTVKAVTDLVKHGDTLLHQQALMATAGMSQTEIAEATAQAWKTASDALGSSVTDNLASIRELRAVFGDNFGAALGNVTTLTRASVALTNLRGGDAEQGRDEVFSIAKALEMHGVSQDPAHFTKLVNEWFKASQAMGGKISGADLMSAMKFGRSAQLGWSDEFIGTILPTLAQEMKSGGGGGAGGPGNALMSAFQAVVGGVMSNKAAEEFLHLGLVDPHKIIRTKTGNIKGLRPGAVHGADEFTSNPYQWVQDVLLPALTTHGIGGSKAQLEEISHLFSNRTAQQIMGLFVTQQQRFQKDAGLITGTPGIDETAKMLADRDPTMIMKQFDVEWNNLLTALGGPLALAALPIMRDLTAGIKSLDDFLIAHPEAGKYIEAIGLGFGTWGTLASVAGVVRVLGAVSGVGSFGAMATAMTGLVPATAGAIAGLLAVNEALGVLDTVAHKIWGDNSTAADIARHAKPAPSWYPSWLPHYPFMAPPGSDASGVHKESFVTPHSQRPIIVQATFVSTLDGRVVAKNVSEHQARYLEQPSSGVNRFDGRMAPSFPADSQRI